MLEVENILNQIKEKKAKFSIHSLINEYKMEEEDAKELCKLAQKDKEIEIYYFFICKACKTLISSGIFRRDLLNKKRKCFACNSQQTLDAKSIELMYEAKTLLEKLAEVVPEKNNKE